MIDNQHLASVMDAVTGPDFAASYFTPLTAYFFTDGRLVSQVVLAGNPSDEAVSVATYGAALGADQACWVGAAPVARPFAVPQLVFVCVRRDGEAETWIRSLSIRDDGSVLALGPLRLIEARPPLVDRVLTPWMLDYPDADAESIAAFLRSRKHKVSP